MRHINIPIFIPHLGCPNQCVFCNQRTISGVEEFDPSDVRGIIEESLSTASSDDEVEIAFFGGSFTGIDRSLMIDLLKIAKEYIDRGRVTSVRCSTRPDYISEEILDILSEYGVKTVELGLQSSSDEVLQLSKRGHSFEAERKAVKLICKRGFELVGQMMIGLPGSTQESELETARFIASSGAVAARIYPTVVFRDTELCEMTACGVYSPLTVDAAVARSAAVLDVFVKAKINVIRIGLCASDNLLSPETYYAGPNHSAIGELVINEYYRREISRQIKINNINDRSSLKIYVSRGSVSKAVGQKKINKILLTEEFSLSGIAFSESDELKEYEILVTEER